MPVAEHYDNWHDDLAVRERLVTMSVNLGPDYYGGEYSSSGTRGLTISLPRCTTRASATRCCSGCA